MKIKNFLAMTIKWKFENPFLRYQTKYLHKGGILFGALKKTRTSTTKTVTST